MRRLAPHLGGVALLVVALAIAFPDRYLGYDSAWSVIWGQQVVDGTTPAFDGPVRAPTPHPLLNAASTALTAVFGADAAGDALAWLGVLGLAAAAWLAALLAARLAGLGAAVLVAALLLTRPFLISELGYATHDLPFLAFVLGAGLAATASPPRPRATLVLLGLAGLLRPEAWPIAVVAALWLGRAGPRRRTLLLVAGACSAPLLWCLQDLLVTGDPLFSLHGTRDLASDLGRPSGSATIPALPEGIGTVLEPLVAWLGVAALLAVAVARERRYAPAVAAGALAALTFLILGAVGLPALPRYLLIPGAALALVLAGVAASRAAAAVVAAVVLAISLPSTLDGLRDARRETAARARVLDALGDVLGRPGAQAAARRCHTVTVPANRALPVASFRLHVDPARIVQSPSAQAGLVLIVERLEDAEALGEFAAAAGAAVAPPPPGARLVARNDRWSAFAAC
jgi:hypothetical protein